MKKGGISVQTENIFPVIKKWLYSDKDIFLRELVSNACDAITKHKRLVSLTEAEEISDEYKVFVTVDRELKTLTVSDNGIGMTEEEVEKYINQIALSGALDFISRYESEDSKSGGIIGHFGLGFYSAFMVADRVEIKTKSYTDAYPVQWDCNESGEYEMEMGSKASQGTDVVLHITDDEKEYLSFDKVKSVLTKYCAFMPYPIYCREGDKEELLNDTLPAWQRSPSELADEDYNFLYKKLFNDYRDPLFYVHINADYPLNFKGILYFPSMRNSMESNEGCIKLFYNSVFVADNIKEIVPDYLYNLSGVLDCPELPLNVSRSYLQDNSYIRKLSQHIVKKLADKLIKLKNDDFDKYSALWDVIKPYIEYGSMKDAKFYDRVVGGILLKATDGGYAALPEILDKDGEVKVYYTTDPVQQAYYVSLYSDKQLPVYVLDAVVDTQFASFVESKKDNVKFLRVDSALDDIGGVSDDNEKLRSLFAEACEIGEDKISFATLGADDAPVLIRCGEEGRRFADMMRMYSAINGTESASAIDEEFVVNVSNAAVLKLTDMDADKAKLLAKHFYLLAIVASRNLSADELKAFLETDRKIAELI